MSLLEIAFGPKLIRVWNSPGAPHDPNYLEKYSSYILDAVEFVQDIMKLSMPLWVLMLYRGGFFTFDSWSMDDFSNFIRRFSCVMLVILLAFVARAIGRARSPAYKNFLRNLVNFERAPTVEKAERIAQTYDCDFRFLPPGFTVTSPLRRPMDIPVYERDANVVVGFAWSALSVILLKTIGRRLLYPGSLEIFKLVTKRMMNRKRAELVEEGEVRGKRAKIGSADGNFIDTMLIDNRGGTAALIGTLVICCEANAAYFEMDYMMNIPRSLGYSVLGWNRPGFACSTGEPLPSQEFHAVDAVMRYATDRLGFPEQNILIYGWSIGGFSASWIAAAYPRIAGVVLDATFDDLLPLAEAMMPRIIGKLVKRVVRRYLNLDIAGLLCQYDGPLLMVRRTQDEIVVTRDPRTKKMVNRGDYLLTRVLSHRYPFIVNEESIPLLNEWLSAVPDQQDGIYRRCLRDVTDDHLTDMLEKFLSLCSVTSPSQIVFPLEIGKDADLASRQHLTLFLARLHMKDLHETHSIPLPASHFTQPWHPFQGLAR